MTPFDQLTQSLLEAASIADEAERRRWTELVREADRKFKAELLKAMQKLAEPKAA